METKKGYAWLVENPTDQFIVIFGPRVDTALKSDHENINTNGQELFETRAAARRVLPTLRERFPKCDIALAWFSFTITTHREMTENDQIRQRFRRSRSLIVIAELDGGSVLIGKLTPGCRRYTQVPGTLITYNNFTPFDRLESALFSCSEYRRQAQSPSKIAIFRMRRLARLQ